MDKPYVKTEEFSLEELDLTIKKLKNNKSPGPDGIPTEFFKMMDEETRLIVLDILNDCWNNEIMPSELELAELVNVENPANYRPTALFNTLYKIYASLIHKRICLGLDRRLWHTQYDFRKCRSTSQPLFITRRLQDKAEQTGDKLFLVFLEWEKAFDKVDQEKLIEAMTRLGLPEKMIDVLSSFYVNLQFRVKDREGKSTYRTQRAGIRQGCPLSPYLFICLMTVMFHDIHEDLDMKLGG